MTEIVFRLYLLTGGSLFVIGLFGLVAGRELLRKVLSVNIMGNGVFLVFVAIGSRKSGLFPDPVPHAMVLTGIVVSVCATGLALALIARIQSMDNSTAEEATE